MKKEINISAILKDKPKGIRLYSPIFGECAFSFIQDVTDAICVTKHNGGREFFNTKGLYETLGECLLFPSKSMRDWRKFTWKKGDVLVNSRGLKILFDRFANDNYTSFYAKTINLVEDAFLDTNLHTLASEKEAKSFIKCIEEKLGGKLNLETLEIEKQHEFKDGDIVVTDAPPYSYYSKCIFILKGDFNTNENSANSYVFFNINNNRICFDVLDTTIRDRNIHLATDSEKQQLFSALEKDGKAWDAEKKQIVDLKPKVELKPFDRVLVRDSKSDYWRANLFGYIDKNGYFRCVYTNWAYCIPYAGNEHLLDTTKDVEG